MCYIQPKHTHIEHHKAVKIVFWADDPISVPSGVLWKFPELPSVTVDRIRCSNVYHEGRSEPVFQKFTLWCSSSSLSKFYSNVTPIFFSSIMNKTMRLAIRSPGLSLSSMTHGVTFRKSLKLSIWRVGDERRRVLGTGSLTDSLSCAWIDSLLCS